MGTHVVSTIRSLVLYHGHGDLGIALEPHNAPACIGDETKWYVIDIKMVTRGKTYADESGLIHLKTGSGFRNISVDFKKSILNVNASRT